jgi:host factor-I protein
MPSFYGSAGSGQDGADVESGRYHANRALVKAVSARVGGTIRFLPEPSRASRTTAMDDQTQLLQNDFLNMLRKQRVPVSVFLVNGIRLAGLIQSFDQYSIRLHGTPPQLVLKRVVATVVPDNKAARAKPAGVGPRTARPKAPPRA